MSWPHVALTEAATIARTGVAPENIVAGTTYVGLENIDGQGDFVGVGSVDAGELASTKFRFTKDQVLFGKLRPYLKKTARPSFDGVCSTDILPLSPAKHIDRDYLFHVLRRQSFVDEVTSLCAGANLPRISPSVLGAMQIPLPPLAEQRRIAAILDKADALRAKRREAIAMLDQLLQSVFLDMFGTLDSSRYPKVSLGEVCTRITDGAHFTPTYTNEGVPFLRVTDIQSKDINWKDVKRIPQSEHDELIKRCCPERGDVLYSKNGTIGIPKLVTWDQPFSIFVSLALLKPDHAKLRSEYLESFLSTPLALKQAIGHSKTGTVTNLHLVEIRKAQIPLPDLGAQDSWIELRRRFEIHRERLVSAAGLLEKLMSSVQQKAFAGTL